MDQHVDTLFVDEGGQFALADALAVGTAARNLVLLGDPNQLPQVSQGSHPPGAEASVLGHLLGDDETVRPDMGIFLEETWRMRPEVNAFISEAFYEGRLEPAAVTSKRSVRTGTASGSSPSSTPGTARLHPRRRMRSRPRSSGSSGRRTWRTAWSGRSATTTSSSSRPTTCTCAVCGRAAGGGRVGTVDKFQGQQATVVFYSMASSSGEQVPRGLEFLFSRNRLNVAVSRARCLAYVVASPRLLEADCKTVEQMRLLNALCRFVEVAQS